jgi:hypothetical protein
MRDGAILINTARGWLVEATRHRRAGSGRLDASSTPPSLRSCSADSPLYDLPTSSSPPIAGALGAKPSASATTPSPRSNAARGEPFQYPCREELAPRVKNTKGHKNTDDHEDTALGPDPSPAWPSVFIVSRALLLLLLRARPFAR